MSISNDNSELTPTLIGKLIGKLLVHLFVGIIITAALHFAFAFTWLQAFVLMWLYCLLKSEVEGVNKAIRR